MTIDALALNVLTQRGRALRQRADVLKETMTRERVRAEIDAAIADVRLGEVSLRGAQHDEGTTSLKLATLYFDIAQVKLDTIHGWLEEYGPGAEIIG